MTNSDDDYIKAGAELLLKGAKMINKSCPTCFSPLYEYNKKIYCVKCKQEYVLVDSPSQMPNQQFSAPSRSSNTVSQSPPSSSVLSETAKVLQEKIAALNSELRVATDPQKIAEITTVIKNLVETLKSLS